ncbi:uncharacterized protein LOC112085325 [Eutrema salsugineum]|uniref:uncharacterized protein LOC112085325 n=1 Tax=Eutrema salsugineum TaxID=72664 RepID=UPI000CED5A6F|nr:uncharacterized protein LOC112085325 [Eutrema salsugineum]
MTTNVAESLNKVLKECREFPLISMLEAIRMSLISWFVRRKSASAAENHAVNPKVRDILDDNFYGCTELKVVAVGSDEYEVYNRKGDRFEVNLVSKSCSCREFQMLLIPCRHAIAATSCCGIEINELWERCTQQNTGEPFMTEFFTQCQHRPPGRPRKIRIPSGEFKRRARNATRICSKCQGKGHNRASCKLPVKDK